MKGYLFDLDGTLIQSMHVWEDAVIRLFERLHLTMDLQEARDVFSAMKFSEVLEAIVQRFELDLSAEQLYDMVIQDVRYQYEHEVKRLGMLDAMEFILSSEESGLTKRTPQMAQEAIRRLGLAPNECIMLEDSLYSMKSAKEAGCYVIAIADRYSQDYAEICRVADEVHEDLTDVNVR